MTICTDFDLVDWEDPVSDDQLNRGTVAWYLVGSPGFRSRNLRNISSSLYRGTVTNASPSTAWGPGKEPGELGRLTVTGVGSNEYVDFGSLAAALSGDDVTVLLRGRYSFSGSNGDALTHNNASFDGHDLGFRAASGQNTRFWVRDGSGTRYSVSLTTGAYQGNGFYWGTTRGSTVESYINGQLIDSTTGKGSGISVDGVLALGKMGERAEYGNATVSEIRVWNRGFTKDDIVAYEHEAKQRHQKLLNRRSTRTYFVPASGVTITPASCTHSHAADSPAITQTHSVAANDATHSQTADSPAITQTHAITVADADHAQTADSPTITQAHVVASDDADHSHTADSPAITQTHVIAAADATHAQTADNVTVTVNAVSITAADADHAQTADSPTVTQSHVVAAADADHVHTADNVTITQAHSVIVADANHSHAADNVTVTVAGVTIDVDDADHGQTADSPTITQTHVITVSGAIHDHVADNVTITTTIQITGPAGIEFTVTGRPADFTLEVSRLDYTTTGRPADFTLDAE